MSDFIDDFHKAVSDWADYLELEGDERDNFIEFNMDKRGYKRATTWTPPEPDENEKGSGSMFSKRRQTAPGKQQQQRQGPPAGGMKGQYFRQGG